MAILSFTSGAFDNLDAVNVSSSSAASGAVDIACAPQSNGISYALKMLGTITGTSGDQTVALDSVSYTTSSGALNITYGLDTPPTVNFDLTKLEMTDIWSQILVNDDWFTMGDSADSIFGGAGNDYIGAGAGNDLIKGGAGNDTLNGGTGTDTAVYTGTRASYEVKIQGSNWTSTDSTPSRDGTDTLTGIERVRFSDSSLALDMGVSQAGGQTALLIGAVLGHTLAFANDSVKQQVLGNVLALFDDTQYNMQILAGALMRLNHDSLDIWSVLAGGNDNTSIARYVLTVVNGSAPDQSALSTAVTALNAETSPATQGTWLAAQAVSSANQTQISLTGLAQTGLVFINA